MHNSKVRDRPCHLWQIQPALREPSVWVEPTANDLHWLSQPDGTGIWESAGRDACFALDSDILGAPLAAGWFELRGNLEVQAGETVLPSVRLCYTQPSILTEFEVLLPEADPAGNIRTLLLFLGDIESLKFCPGTDPARFRMHRFSLCRVSRTHALLAMLGRAAGRSSVGGAQRLFDWGRAVRRRGLKHATDQLYARYRQRMRPRCISEYEAWVRKYDTLDDAALQAFRQRALAQGGDGAPSISLLLYVGDTSEEYLRRCLDSVLAQVWSHWELCAVAGASPQPHVMTALGDYAARDSRFKVVRHEGDCRASALRNEALAIARGDFVALLDADGALRPHSLLRIVETVAADPELAILYSDEDRIDAAGVRRDPDFKPDWNPDLLRSQDYMGHLVVFRTELVREVGGFRAGLEGCDALDLVLRCSERIAPRQIRRVAQVLYHGNPEHASATECSAAASLRVVAEHLERIGSAAEADTDGMSQGSRRVRWPLPLPVPKISVIIPTRDRVDVLRRCVESILALTTYPDFELVVVDNRSSDRRSLEYLQELASRGRVRVLRRDAPFNFSAINNWAARQCTGQLLALVNNDVEVISPDWLEEMAGFAVRPDTGAVGAMLYYPDDTIQHAGMLLGVNGVAGHPYAGRTRGHAGYRGRAQVAQNLSAVTGACLLVRRALFDAVGGLDEELPVEFNDVDFCLRLGQRGYRNVWTPFAELYHHESASRALEDASAKRMRGDGMGYMIARWRKLLRDDPAYNPNLSLQSLDFELAFPPRFPAADVRTGNS